MIGSRYLLPRLQAACSSGLSILARTRMRFINDSGTPIGVRATLFKDVIPSGGIGAELGVYKGTLSKFILEANRPARLHLIDPWWKYMPEWHWAEGDKSTARSLGALIITLADDIGSGRVEVHIGDSIGTLSSFEDGYLDWAYVDSTHAYEQTKQELALLKRKVKASGIIAGDDWQANPTHRHHGVYLAVQEFLASEPEYRIVFQERAQWALQRK